MPATARFILLAVAIGSLAAASACRREPQIRKKLDSMVAVAGAQTKRARPTPRRADTTRRDSTAEAGGEVEIVADTLPADTLPPVRWLSDANLLSLASLMNARQITAAEIELENWHVVGIRDFALAMYRDHTSLQRAIDSASQRLNIVPSRPAVADLVSYQFQAQLDTMLIRGRGTRGALDLAFVDQQISSHALMSNYLLQLAAAAEQPEVQGFLTSLNTRVAAQLAQARAMRGRGVVSDSILTDSAKKVLRAQQKKDSILKDSTVRRDTTVRPDTTR